MSRCLCKQLAPIDSTVKLKAETPSNYVVRYDDVVRNPRILNVHQPVHEAYPLKLNVFKLRSLSSHPVAAITCAVAECMPFALLSGSFFGTAHVQLLLELVSERLVSSLVELGLVASRS